MKFRIDDAGDAMVLGFGVFIAGIGLCASIAMITCAVQSYNNRAECQRLGVPLYRCEAKTYKADVSIEDKNGN